MFICAGAFVFVASLLTGLTTKVLMFWQVKVHVQWVFIVKNGKQNVTDVYMKCIYFINSALF